ncbi:MAG: hypothetical protein KIT48_12150 [Pseudolabrys sp.]|nr:hypothetical protein [Pseudolabrys sp.]
MRPEAYRPTFCPSARLIDRKLSPIDYATGMGAAMARYRFKVRSSSSFDTYQLEAYQTAAGIRFSCTCQAAGNDQHCKHRLALIAGDVTQLESRNVDDLKALSALVTGTALAASIAALAQLEDEATKIKARINGEKKNIARLMMG